MNLQWSVDPKSYELAEHFAQGENFSEQEIKDLSKVIQDACEDFIAARNRADEATAAWEHIGDSATGDAAADGRQHPDDAAVDRFALAMKAKLAEKRDQGKAGWHDPAVCTIEDLWGWLRHHVIKGDPVDVGNFAMMIWNRATDGQRDLLTVDQVLSTLTPEQRAATEAIRQQMFGDLPSATGDGVEG